MPEFFVPEVFMSEVLSGDQVGFYNEQGYLVVENHIPLNFIEDIRAEIDRFEVEAISMTESNDRIDLEDSHTPEAPRLRRIKLPHTTSDVVKKLMYSDYILAVARDLIGPNIRLHTTKLNMKSAGFGAAVEWHQDLAFYPHTNDDVLAIAVILDDMEHENGPLMVLPKEHRGQIYNHHADGVFVGTMDLKANGLNLSDAVELRGPAGSISIHHGRIPHGSALNTSSKDRRLLFFEVMAADAFPIMGSMTKFSDIEEYNQRMLCGEPTVTPRIENIHIRIPQPQPDKNRSIYEIQKNAKTRVYGDHQTK